MKLPLKKVKTHANFKPLQWNSCSPFVDNNRAVLIHRPKSVSTHTNSKGRSHIAVSCWCGTVFIGKKNLTFLDAPSGKLLCARCEKTAVKNGMPSADYIVGTHVHVGGVSAVQQCHLNKEQP